jgi:3-phenylpropionate/trans-cinnamate dioxygenase ferredoxin subunit
MTKELLVSQFVKVAVVSKVPSATMRAVDVKGRWLILVHTEGEVLALDARCPPRGGSLDQSNLWQGIVECPWHHYRYDARTGQNLHPRNDYPADLASLQGNLGPVRRYAAQVINEQIWVAV